MVLPAVRLVPIGFILMACMWTSTVPLSAQEAPGRWILGVWEGAHAANQYVREDKTRFEFTEAGGAIRWKRTREWHSMTGGKRWDEASGTVVKITDTTAELDGRYDAAISNATVGKGIRYSLTRSADDALSGHAIGATNIPYAVEIKRAR